MTDTVNRQWLKIRVYNAKIVPNISLRKGFARFATIFPGQQCAKAGTQYEYASRPTGGIHFVTGCPPGGVTFVTAKVTKAIAPTNAVCVPNGTQTPLRCSPDAVRTTTRPSASNTSSFPRDGLRFSA